MQHTCTGPLTFTRLATSCQAAFGLAGQYGCGLNTGPSFGLACGGRAIFVGTSILPGNGEIDAMVEGLGVDQATYLPPWSEDNSRTPTAESLGRDQARNLVGERSCQTRCHFAADERGGSDVDDGVLVE